MWLWGDLNKTRSLKIQSPENPRLEKPFLYWKWFPPIDSYGTMTRATLNHSLSPRDQESCVNTTKMKSCRKPIWKLLGALYTLCLNHCSQTNYFGSTRCRNQKQLTPKVRDTCSLESLFLHRPKTVINVLYLTSLCNGIRVRYISYEIDWILHLTKLCFQCYFIQHRVYINLPAAWSYDMADSHF